MKLFDRNTPFIALIFGLHLFDNALAQSTDPAWLDELRTQMALEKECEVAYFLNMMEREKNAIKTFTARVQCTDGRMFDAIRTDPDTDFQVSPCGLAVCQVQNNEADKS